MCWLGHISLNFSLNRDCFDILCDLYLKAILLKNFSPIDGIHFFNLQEKHFCSNRVDDRIPLGMIKIFAQSQMF